MNTLAIARTPSADDAPLSIGQILASGLAAAPQQQIVYGDRFRGTYATLVERVGRLASGLASLGVDRAPPWRSWTGTATATSSASSPSR